MIESLIMWPNHSLEPLGASGAVLLGQPVAGGLGRWMLAGANARVRPFRPAANHPLSIRIMTHASTVFTLGLAMVVVLTGCNSLRVDSAVALACGPRATLAGHMTRRALGLPRAR